MDILFHLEVFFGNHILQGHETILPLITDEDTLFRVTDAAIGFLKRMLIRARDSDFFFRELGKMNSEKKYRRLIRRQE